MHHTQVNGESVKRNNFFLVNPHAITMRADRNISRDGFDVVSDSIRQLAESMAPREDGGSGQISPIIVRPIDKDQLECVAGFRRLAAARYLIDSGICTDYKIKYVVMRLNDAEAALMNLTENMEREDPNPIQIANAIRCLNEDYGMSFKDISVKLKRPASTISNMVNLVSLPKSIQDSVIAGTTTVSAAIELARMPASEQAQAFEVAGSDGAKVTPARVKAAKATTSVDDTTPRPRTTKQVRAYLEGRTPVSALDAAFTKTFLGFLDGTASDREMDDLWDDVLRTAKAAGVSSTVEI